MNLKDWDKMSPEEQRAYWDKATLAQRQILSGLSFASRPHRAFSQIPETSNQKRCCDAYNWLKKQIPEEVIAAYDYHATAETLDGVNKETYGEPSQLASVLNRISDEEFGHYLLLEAITTILNDQCKCKED